MKHLVLPNDFKEFSSKFSQQKFEKKRVFDNSSTLFMNKSNSLGNLSLDRVEEIKNDDELKKKRIFQHFDVVKDQFEEKNLHKKPSYIENSESPIRESNENEEETKECAKKRLTPRGKHILFNVSNVKCDELDGFEKKNAEELEETIFEVKEELIVEKCGKKGMKFIKFLNFIYLLCLF